ncbi:hypothetical protein DFP72DRAFT_881529 [Ephemerocybe angulata]|uniref:Uncharacterized protein n=1 Tax=Ephemerocybe angulata TaxID=980116 RepID=A0A8H6I8C8_9AGAR|nr:hypothetical protein DFP72DRAFT_881529 [Tulosesus angulatus]
MASYSAFFSSPIRPASPLPTHSDAIVVDEPMELDYPSGRESTPTQHTVTASLQAAAKITSTAAGSSATAQPRLRRRRSSLTIGVSPLTAIRSPTRTVGAALQMQRHLAMNPGRSRGGSLSSSNPPSAVEGFMMFGMATSSSVASEGTSLAGRLRSGSVGSNVYHTRAPLNPPATAGITSRYVHVRRVTSVPAPVPPPSAPLPALPQVPFSAGMAKAFTRTPFSYQNHDMPGSAGIPAAMSGQKLKGRDRGFSVSSTVGRIDEEMKEN